MDNETIYRILTNNDDIKDTKLKELIDKMKESLIKYKFFDSKVIYNADFFKYSCKVSDIFINKFNIYNSTLLKYINKDTCIECNNNFIKCYGYCLKHIKNLDIISLHKELLTIFINLSDIEKINLKLSIAEIMFEIKRSKSIIKSKIKTYEDKIFKQQKIIEIIRNNKEFINNNKVSYKELIDKYKLSDKEKEKLFKKNNKIDFRITYEINDDNLLNVNQNIINIFRLRQLIYEETRLISFFNNTDDIRDIHIDTSDYLIIELLKHNLINRRIMYLEREKSIKINKIMYRSDIFMIIETNKYTLMPVIIETDEKHHKNDENIINNDRIKDKHFILQGFSVLRIDINNDKNIVEQTNIKLVINKLIDLIELDEPIYYFSDKYIENHRIKSGIIITQEMLDKYTKNNIIQET